MSQGHGCFNRCFASKNLIDNIEIRHLSWLMPPATELEDKRPSNRLSSVIQGPQTDYYICICMKNSPENAEQCQLLLGRVLEHSLILPQLQHKKLIYLCQNKRVCGKTQLERLALDWNYYDCLEKFDFFVVKNKINRR